ncbi:MAG: GH3 auxin-responsive promoter family protein [Candidatus Obscuribacter sp.]|nr:GH3 auxin-responsive promoter family protein [Candidatus Obscuribacter sp.]MBK7837610.1 GH3 auxin-responsive promoter family protein [Candidatus Obscuribacter sp.]MBK9618322.1 GH3 auxin-responsive promoter family protein [Candidatus Obscuribacter sp.]
MSKLFKKLEIAAGQKYRQLTHVSRFYRALRDPAAAQRAKLKTIVDANRDTAFGKAHKFDLIATVDDFRKHVPVSNYEYFEPYIERLKQGESNQLTRENPVMFATTSGTTDKPKFVPITPAHIADYTHAFQIHNYHLVKDFYRAAIGRFLIITSNDEEGLTEGGLPFGAVSGMLNRRQSPIVRKYFALPYELCKVKDVDAKYYLLLRAALVQNITAFLGCNPSSFLLLADQLRDRVQDLIKDIHDGTVSSKYAANVAPSVLAAFEPYLRPDVSRASELEHLLNSHGELLPRHVFPNASVMSCWKGGPMGFYLSQLPDLYGDLPIRDFGYMASEGRGTIPIADGSAAGPLALTSHFFEFVHEDQIDNKNPRYLMAHELTVGQKYFVFFTTSAGLYRYNINDLMLVEGMLESTPLLSFVRKGGGVSSVTGEKVTEEQILSTLNKTVQALALTEIRHFTAEVMLDRPPYYLCYAEVDSTLAQHLRSGFQEKFLEYFDRYLREANPEYNDKRESRRLGMPCMRLLAPGTYALLRQQRVHEGAPEAQVKIPLLSSQGVFAGRLSLIGS